MQSLTKLSVIVFFLSFCVYSQQLSRPQKIEELRKLKTKIEQMQNEIDQMQEQHQKIYEEVAFISEKDAEEAKRIGAEVFRLFPDRILDDLMDFPEGGSASIYSLEGIAGEYDSPEIEFKDGGLEFVNEISDKKNIGFIANIGGTLLETINENSPEFVTLAKYQPPPEIKNVKKDYESDGLKFSNKATVTVGNTYLLRAVSYGSGDGIFAMKIQRKDTDNSIIIFVKKLKNFEPPQFAAKKEPKPETYQQSDSELYSKCQNVLFEKGFTNVQIEVSNGTVTLRGTVPKGKLGEVLMAISELKPKKVENQLTEQR